MECNEKQLQKLEDIGIIFSSDPLRVIPSYEEYLLYFNEGDIYETTIKSRNIEDISQY